ncbi:hypothetical protein MNEG_13397 [Monoraphidium neglectum]|uniref:Uncharacterized protein n=1 Tax=Monoraphidium neglectum TaxID=145388 RepID=A0A0D2LSC2_9CHLO|nr:hypothetical protein MNEG_13397 [Monoraphidium neglectum]KIY94564.1 hypothetical protein MNEG_13397 [Monoraphidium neglectum]|eukprot:XP_013893584.1 hypothetical protein MNEG_13397 [Monoraphidium neglectum]
MPADYFSAVDLDLQRLIPLVWTEQTEVAAASPGLGTGPSSGAAPAAAPHVGTLKGKRGPRPGAERAAAPPSAERSAAASVAEAAAAAAAAAEAAAAAAARAALAGPAGGQGRAPRIVVKLPKAMAARAGGPAAAGGLGPANAGVQKRLTLKVGAGTPMPGGAW